MDWAEQVGKGAFGAMNGADAIFIHDAAQQTVRYNVYSDDGIEFLLDVADDAVRVAVPAEVVTVQMVDAAFETLREAITGAVAGIIAVNLKEPATEEGK